METWDKKKLKRNLGQSSLPASLQQAIAHWRRNMHKLKVCMLIFIVCSSACVQAMSLNGFETLDRLNGVTGSDLAKLNFFSTSTPVVDAALGAS